MNRLSALIGMVLAMGGTVLRSDDVALVGVGEVWRYQAAVDELPSSWLESEFDDRAWLAGESGFGASTWGENTLFTGLIRGSGSIYFRKSFVVSDPNAVRTLTLRCDWQGGFVAYLNGVEIARRNLPGFAGTPVPIEAPPSVRYAGVAEEIPVPDPGLWLRSGTNVLALQAHPDFAGGLDVVVVPELLANFTRGPYLQSVLEDRATVMWRTPGAASGQVEFGTDENLGRVVEASAVLAAQEVVLSGLQAGTRYHYRVRSGAGPDAAISPIFSFRTLPASGDLDLVLFGDSGAGSAAQFRVARQLARSEADVLVHLGDIVYPHFTVGRTDTRCLSVYRELLRTTPFYFAWGNHDLYGGTEPFLTAFRQPTNSVTLENHRAEGTRPEFFYSFDAGDVHVAVLFWPYSNQYYMREGCPQLQWLEKDLATTTKPWKILALHHPVNTSGYHRFDDYNRNLVADRIEVAERLLPVARRHGVQLIASGHDHNYERFHPIGGTHTVVTGGGGIILYGILELDANSAAFAARWHYTSVQVRGDMIRLKAVDWDGRAFDALEWRRTSPDSGDSDGDGLGDVAELALGTRPDDPDTDGDGLADGWEFLRDRDPRTRDVERAELRLAPLLARSIPRTPAELTAIATRRGGVELRWLTTPGNDAVVEGAESADGEWQRLPFPPDGPDRDGGLQRLDVSAGSRQQFFRVRLIPE